MTLQNADAMKAIRLATRDSHGRLEAVLPFASDQLTLERYIEVLAAFLGIIEPLEEAIWRCTLPSGLLREERERAPLLTKDLRTLGLTDRQIESAPRCAEVPAYRTSAQALGALYVLEGSTLGGQVLERILSARLGLSSEAGCAFFCGHGTETARKWKRFGEIVQEAVSQSDLEVFVESAQGTFTTFERWIQKAHA